jgi:hypothetical protein
MMSRPRALPPGAPSCRFARRLNPPPPDIVVGEQLVLAERKDQADMRSYRGGALELSLIFADNDVMQDPSPLTLQFLAWLSTHARTYGDVMEAWRTTCPRMSVWEDAVRDGLIHMESAGKMNDSKVTLSAKGRAALNGS